MAKLTPQQILSLPMPEGNDAEAATVRDLSTLWAEREGFSGKRPFGNSGWEYDLYTVLAGHGAGVAAEFDEDGYLEHVDEHHADRLIREAIRSLGAESEAS